MQAKSQNYLEIVDWDDFLHPDTRRKCKPPFRWCKLPTEFLDTHGDLSCREFGAYVRLIMLAASTNNRTAYNPTWIRRRAGVSRQVIESLSSRGLVRIGVDSVGDEKTQEKQTTFSKTASSPQANLPQTARLEGKGLDLTRPEGKAPPGIRPNGKQPGFSQMIDVCLDAGLSGSNWNGIKETIETTFGFIPTEKQVRTIELQLNDRAGK